MSTFPRGCAPPSAPTVRPRVWWPKHPGAKSFVWLLGPTIKRVIHWIEGNPPGSKPCLGESGCPYCPAESHQHFWAPAALYRGKNAAGESIWERIVLSAGECLGEALWQCSRGDFFRLVKNRGNRSRVDFEQLPVPEEPLTIETFDVRPILERIWNYRSLAFETTSAPRPPTLHVVGGDERSAAAKQA